MTEPHGAALALREIAYVAGELVAVREAGFSDAALAFPRSEAGLLALCAFNGIKVEQAPRGWRYWPNAGMKACWERVIEAMCGWDATTIARELHDAAFTYGHGLSAWDELPQHARDWFLERAYRLADRATCDSGGDRNGEKPKALSAKHRRAALKAHRHNPSGVSPQ